MACYFSCLADPLVYTFLLASLYAAICQLGYSRAAELIYSSFTTIFGRNEYKKFMASWKELQAAKAQVKKVSAQDEFAKWAKLQRKVDKLQADFDKQYSSRQKGLLAVQFIGSVVLRVVTYVCLASFFYCNKSTSVLSLELFTPELQFSPLLGKIMAFPSAEIGSLSAPIWSAMVLVAMREFFNFL